MYILQQRIKCIIPVSDRKLTHRSNTTMAIFYSGELHRCVSSSSFQSGGPFWLYLTMVIIIHLLTARIGKLYCNKGPQAHLTNDKRNDKHACYFNTIHTTTTPHMIIKSHTRIYYFSKLLRVFWTYVLCDASWFLFYFAIDLNELYVYGDTLVSIICIGVLWNWY